jgi:tetratricopeptide (TPR) repeat protein
MSAKKTNAARARATGRALELFEKAAKALGKRDFDRALQHLNTLAESHPGERDILERAESYRQVCLRAKKTRSSVRPKTVEDLLHHAVYLHNRGEHKEALKFLNQAAEKEPKNDHVLYCLAAAAAQSGDTDGALEALESAIAVSPETRTQARLDSDFDPIREEDGFAALINAS